MFGGGAWTVHRIWVRVLIFLLPSDCVRRNWCVGCALCVVGSPKVVGVVVRFEFSISAVSNLSWLVTGFSIRFAEVELSVVVSRC